MSTRLRILLPTVLILAGWTLPMALHAQGVNLEAAKKEGKAVIYGTIVPQVMSQIEKGFEAKYGIKTEYWRAHATKVIDPVLTQRRAGKPGFWILIGAPGPFCQHPGDYLVCIGGPVIGPDAVERESK